jgi:hypothetical protein
MKGIKKFATLNEILEKYPKLEETLKQTYGGVEIYTCDGGILDFIKTNKETGDVWGIITDARFLPFSIFSDIERLYKDIGKDISSLVLVRPEVIDNDIAYDFYFSSFTEIRIKKTFFGKRSFRIKYENTVSKYISDFFHSER